jgi:predicted component of type VI protein secretion system
MTIKTTLTMDRAIYKAAKRVAVEYDTTVSAMLRKALLIYVSDPESMEETVTILRDTHAMEAIQAGEEARRRKRKDYYLDWDEIRDL